MNEALLVGLLLLAVLVIGRFIYRHPLMHHMPIIWMMLAVVIVLILLTMIFQQYAH